ncbi:MAG: hypothetical protein ABW189_07745 [Rickettsiales bacterium]
MDKFIVFYPPIISGIVSVGICWINNHNQKKQRQEENIKALKKSIDEITESIISFYLLTDVNEAAKTIPLLLHRHKGYRKKFNRAKNT